MKILFKGCTSQSEYLKLGRDDEAFTALLEMPWVNEEDHFTFYVTMVYLLPKAIVAVRHLFTEVTVDGDKMQVKGFRILVNAGAMYFAIHAIMLAEPQK